jgi:hypothetical protein
VYFKNGTVAYSWLEGGVTNKIAYAANILSLSANVYIWFRAPPSTSFLPANSGTAPTNTVYIGFASPTNVLMDGNFIGEAPDLSPIYGEYDNGAKVFNYYLVNPTSTTGWSVNGNAGLSTNAPTGSYFQTQNAFYAVSTGDTNYMYNSAPAFAPGNVISYWVYITLNNLGDLFFMDSSSGAGQLSRLDERTSSYPTDSGFLPATSWTTWSGGGNFQDPPPGSWDKIDVAVPNASDEIMYDTPVSNTPLGTFGSYNTGLQTPTIDGNYFGLQGDTAYGSNDYWDAIIVRDYLPGGNSPIASSYPVSLYTAPSGLTLTPSSQSATPGSTVTITSTGLTGGISPYTYQWYTAIGNVPINDPANALEANTLLGTGTMNGNAQSPNAIFVTNSMTSTGTYYFALYATDQYPTTVNSVASITLQQQQSSNGGTPQPSYNYVITDNIGSASSSSQPVVTIYYQEGITLYQDQLPYSISTHSPTLGVSYACNFAIGTVDYSFSSASGMQSCGNETQINPGTESAIYTVKNKNTTTTTIVNTTSISTTSITQTTTPFTTVATTSVIPLTTTIVQRTTPAVNTTNLTSLQQSQVQAFGRMEQILSNPIYLSLAILGALLVAFFILAMKRRKKKE